MLKEFVLIALNNLLRGEYKALPLPVAVKQR
jgi:hypothetical protein